MATRLAPEPPRRSAPFDQEPGFYPDAKLWLYGNVRLLGGTIAHLSDALGEPRHSPKDLTDLEHQAEALVLAGKTLISGIHNAAHQRVAVVPLRWGAPRILVLSGGFYHHLGQTLTDEPFRVARLWRYQFDPRQDLVISRRAPDKAPTFALYNPTVDRLIEQIVGRRTPGLLFAN